MHNFKKKLITTLSRKRRKAFSIKEYISLLISSTDYLLSNKDPIYNGKYQKKFENDFCNSFGGGFSKAVNSGTNGIYIAIRSLELPIGSKIGVTALIDPGVVNAIIIAGYEPVLLDIVSKDKLYLSSTEIYRAIDLNIVALILVHYYGYSAPAQYFSSICRRHNIKLIEDCSQCHYGSDSGKRIGLFGDIAVFSTMSRKSTITGASGGIIYTLDKNLYQKISSFSDRGKDTISQYSNPRKCSENINISLNFNTDEFSSAIGISSLRRLKTSTIKRLKLAKFCQSHLMSIPGVHTPLFCSKDCPFIIPIFFSNEIKDNIINSFNSYGIDFSNEYDQCASKWPWLLSYISHNEKLINSEDFARNHLLLYIHEGYNIFYRYLFKQAIKEIKNSILTN
tara:strand:- start:2625 stop:3806 length:1182 start_codon:yes stop_codon:yes gene_type:complete